MQLSRDAFDRAKACIIQHAAGSDKAMFEDYFEDGSIGGHSHLQSVPAKVKFTAEEATSLFQ